jgi:hypothetical protein
MRNRDLAEAEQIKDERTGDLMEKLLKIRIDGPEDWSENIDAYLNGEKPLGNGKDPR